MIFFKFMHNFYRPYIWEILFEVVRSKNIIDICESSLVARADSNSCRDFEKQFIILCPFMFNKVIFLIQAEMRINYFFFDEDFTLARRVSMRLFAV